MKILIPFHIGSGNRGCEGIIRGTANILRVNNQDLLLLDRDQGELDLDIKLGLEEVGTLFVKKNRLLFSRVLKRVGICTKSYYLSPYKKFINTKEKDVICLFTGGDLFCYASTIKENCQLLEHLNKRHVKTFLWGASIEERFIDIDVKTQLKNFERILCRETLTLETLKRHGISENVVCLPDPAFTLEPVKTSLPGCFEKNKVIGVNISNMVNGNSFSMDTPFMKSMQRLFKYIISETDYYILLIPHVTWGSQDDRKMCNIVYETIQNKDRIGVLNVNDMGYLQIRHIISKCELFVGGRTHSVISAYSTEVPTLALGYSVKAVGIAKDLGLEECLVFDSNKIESEDSLLLSFKYLDEHKDDIKNHLHKTMPQYKRKAFGAKEIVSQYLC